MNRKFNNVLFRQVTVIPNFLAGDAHYESFIAKRSLDDFALPHLKFLIKLGAINYCYSLAARSVGEATSASRSGGVLWFAKNLQIKPVGMDRFSGYTLIIDSSP